MLINCAFSEDNYMTNYSKLILALALCLQSIMSVAMSSGMDSTSYSVDCASATIAAGCYGAFIVAKYFKEEHETRNRSLLRGQIDKKTAKALMATPEVQQLITSLHADQANRKQQFFLAHNRTVTKDSLIKAGFAKMLHDRCLFDHASRIIGFLSLSETVLDAQLIQLEKMHIFERAGLRDAIVRRGIQKARTEHTKNTTVTRSFFVAACTAGSTAYCSL